MDDVNQFLTTYIGEAIFIVVGILIFLLVVILKQKKEHPKDLTIHKTESANNVKHTTPSKQTKKLDAHHENLEIKSSTIPAIEPLKSTQPKQTTIPKQREFVPHGIITKESFQIFAGSKLLIAEDNLINQKVINGMLGDSGIDIIMADNGQEALDILKDNKDIYVVLMDAHMPIVDGFEATQRIRADKSLDHLLVVALSGDTAVDDIKKMKNAGMQEYLEKPLKLEKLYDILYCYLNIIDEKTSNSINNQTTKVLNIDKGLNICGNDNDLYKEILLEFLNIYQDVNQTINSYIEKDNIPAIQKLLLDISGISANIGADKLSIMSTEFREILNDKRKGQYFTYEKKFNTILMTLLEEIHAYIN
jgi:CheY-like chemotaxis protein